MTRGRSKAQWAMAAELIAAIYNTVRDAKKRPRPFTGRDFNPHTPKKTAGIEAFGRLAGIPAHRAAAIAQGK